MNIEQLVIDISFFIVHDLFQAVFYYIMLMFMLTPKYNKVVVLLVLTMINTLCRYAVQPAPALVYFFAYLAVTFIPILFIFKEKKIICLFAVGIIEASALLIDAALSAFFSETVQILENYYPTKTVPYTWNAVFAMITLNVMYSCMFVLIVIIWCKVIKKYNIKSLSLFILFPVGQALFTVACAYPTTKFKVLENPFMSIAVIVSIASDIIMFIALRDNNNLETAKERAAAAEKEMELQLQYYSELIEKMTEIREYRHDINNLVSVAEALITDDSSQSSKDFIGEMKHKAEGMKIPVYTSSEIANAVLWKKEQEAKQAGVDFKVKADVGESFPLDKIDICSLFANLLDNAVNEAKETEEKTVEVTMGRRFGLLMVEVVNSANDNPEIAGRKKPKSAKEGDHGHGLGIVEKIAEKYGGKFVFEVKDGKARAAASLSV